jgi:hypothetical protein
MALRLPVGVELKSKNTIASTPFAFRLSINSSRLNGIQFSGYNRAHPVSVRAVHWLRIHSDQQILQIFTIHRKDLFFNGGEHLDVLRNSTSYSR